MFVKAFFRLCRVKNLGLRPGHIDTATELVEAFGDLYQRGCLSVQIAFKPPAVEQRDCGIEQARANELVNSDFTDASRITADSIEIVVGHEILIALSVTHCRGGDGGRVE